MPQRLLRNHLVARSRAPRFPGLNIWERELLHRHIDTTLAPVLRFYANVPCGPIPDVERDATGWPTDAELENLYARKIDLIAELPADWWICELKPHADYRALGQLLTYAHHVATDYPAMVRPRLVILTDKPAHDLAPIAAQHGIVIYSTPGEQPIYPDYL